MANLSPSFRGKPQNGSFSSTGVKPTRILKLRAKKVTSEPGFSLTNSVSEPTINQVSPLTIPLPVENSRKLPKNETQIYPSRNMGTPPSFVLRTPEYDLLKRRPQIPDSLLASIEQQGEEINPPIISRDSQKLENEPQTDKADDLDIILDNIAINRRDAELLNYSKVVDKLALDSGVDMSPLKSNSLGHSSPQGSKYVTLPLEKQQIRIETTLPTPITEFSSADLLPCTSFGSDIDKLTPVSPLTPSSSSVLADQSSTTSSVQSEEHELQSVPNIHRRDMSFESDLTDVLSITSTFRDTSPQPSLRSLTVTPASERVQMVTPSDEYDQIPDDIQMLLYDLHNGQFSGYSIDLFLDHHSVLKAMYSCPQCKCIIREPHFSEWEACCKICLPKLRTPQKVKQAIFDKHLNKKIQSLPVKCPLTGRGCQWRGKLKHMEGHLNQSCPYMRYRCPHNGCDQVFYRKSLEDHVNGDCGERKTNCPHCNTEIPVLRFNEHLIYVNCPKECSNTEIPQCQLGLHILKKCGKILVPCPYSSYGCEEQIPRGDIHEHMLVQNGEHLRLLRTLVDDSRSTIEKLVEENENLQAKIESGRRESAFLEKNISLPGTLLWKIPQIFHQMKTKHVVESKELVIEGYRIYALLWFGGWHSPGDVELGIIRNETEEDREWPVFFRVRYTIIHPTDSTQAITADTTAKFDRKPIREKKEKTWNKAQGYVSGFIPIQTRNQLHAFLMDNSLYLKVEIEIVNTLPVL
ncbi:TNF receptor-associated factor 3 [Oopsacas minuta]|uniref:TNF receptor-associated factor 3 n=1 Tax=Oopsacas minuta TaxID=111878 RepID=A0AAV7JSA2_9METZ|nr:TNF receptor-associated factor 3 [Oopsacas minuta]